MNVTDYLLKLFEIDRFLAAINKVKTAQSQLKTVSNECDRKNFIFINVQKRKVKIFYSDILYIESQKENVKVVTF